MFSDIWDDLPQPPPQPQQRKGIFSDSTLHNWKHSCRDRYVLELLRLDSCGDGLVLRTTVGSARVASCYVVTVVCKNIRKPHYMWWRKLTHFESGMEWNTFSANITEGARSEGAAGAFAWGALHQPGGRQEWCIFVGVSDEGTWERQTFSCCRSVGTWHLKSDLVLEEFHMITLQAKTTMYNYYKSLEKFTVNNGTKPPDRYQVFICMAREYWHLMMPKRGGCGHEPGGANATKSDELAVVCLACLWPGINLPEDWENTSKEDKWSYMLENELYREYLLTVTDQKEMVTCSGLATLDYAKTKFSRGYNTTSMRMGVCARHKFIQLTGAGDLQRSERFANMDDIFGSILRYHDPLLNKTVLYDVVHIWWLYLMERLRELPPLVGSFLILPLIAFVILKMHIKGHKTACGIEYLLNLTPGSGQTNGEGIKRPWAKIGGIASSTRIMGPGAWHDTIDNHWGHWNWQKLISLAETLQRRLDNVLEQEAIQQDTLAAFSEQQQDCVDSWKKIVHNYEKDHEQPEKEHEKLNLHETVVIGLMEAEVRLQFQKEEEDAAKRGLPARHRVSLSAFLTEGLDIEEEQYAFWFLDFFREFSDGALGRCEVRAQVALKKMHTTTQQIDMGALRTKLIRRLDRLHKIQGTYSPTVIVVLEEQETPADEQPENEPLFLLSALSDAQHVGGGCTEGLWEMELLMRNAQCHAVLVKLCNQLVIKGRFLNYKTLHTRHQGATTCSRGIVIWNELKIQLHSEKYQTAWNVLFASVGQDKTKVGWRRLRKEDIRCIEDAEDLALKVRKRKGAIERRQRKLQELLDHGVDLPAWAEEGNKEDDEEDEDDGRRQVGESRREVSWIWTAAGSTRTDADLNDALHIKWVKAYARSRRWSKEVWLLKEDLRRLPISLEFQADVWKDRAQRVLVGTGVLDEVHMQWLIVYTLKQEALFRDMVVHARETEKALKLGKGKKEPRAANVDPLLQAMAEDGTVQKEDHEGLNDGDNREAEEERGRVESDEEVIMGGELDNFWVFYTGTKIFLGRFAVGAYPFWDKSTCRPVPASGSFMGRYWDMGTFKQMPTGAEMMP
ncbi:hypothetical protein K438DRAFT_1939164 [Mycena galopus ATCC 62051]|nr:hypothetical protein K438DRAFT_1939164 [Mycena galopus ATCC 62051]